MLSKGAFHTYSMIMVRVTRLPALRIKYSRSANSLEVSSMVGPARVTFAFNSVEPQVFDAHHRFSRKSPATQKGS